MPSNKRIVIIAGEESGDMHAAAFIRDFKKSYPHVHFSGIGGKHLQELGIEMISNLAQYGVTGLYEVLRHFLIIKKAFEAIKKHLNEKRPDLLILVDYPGFNLRLARYAKQKLGIPVLYYIGPQIWAWKAGRIHTIRDNVDHMAVILPFEKKIYEQAGIPVSFVGHPLVNKVKPCEHQQSTRIQLNLPLDKRIIALLPGSRQHEIEKHMPILRDTAIQLTAQYPDLHLVFPVASTINPNTIHDYLNNQITTYQLIEGQTLDVVGCSDYAIVASGTASLECALLGIPMCIIYKTSLLTYLAAIKLIKVKYLGLCNLLQDQMIAPELLQDDCNSIELTKTIVRLLNEPAYSARMVERLQRLRYSLSNQSADCSLKELAEKMLNLTN
ncbi:MAG: lipid-A-disaccharide synthase [Legionella sp.]